MKAEFTAVVEKGEKFFIAYCPEVPGANGQGNTVEECVDNLKEAIRLILEDRLADGLRSLPESAETIKIKVEL